MLEDVHAEVVDFYLVTVETEFGEAFCFVSNTITHVREYYRSKFYYWVMSSFWRLLFDNHFHLTILTVC